MRRAVAALVVLIAAVAPLVRPPAAPACSCAAAGYVGDSRLIGTRTPPGLERDGKVEFFHAPCCESPGGRVMADRIRGVPASVAILDGDSLYVAEGQLRQLRDHPLGDGETVTRRDCEPGPAFTTRAAYAGTLRGRGGRQVLVDDRTRLTNRPVTASLLAGQRVRVTTDRCPRALRVNTLAFTGPEPALEPRPDIPADRPGDPGDGLGWEHLLIGGFVTLVAAWIVVFARVQRGLSRS